MEENKTPCTEAEVKNEKKCCTPSDLRIFGISLLTAIIVITCYHLGTIVCRMICPSECKDAPRYMLVEVRKGQHGRCRKFEHCPGKGKRAFCKEFGAKKRCPKEFSGERMGKRRNIEKFRKERMQRKKEMIERRKQQQAAGAAAVKETK